ARERGVQGLTPAGKGAMRATRSPPCDATRTSRSPRSVAVETIWPVSVRIVRRTVVPSPGVAVKTVDQSVNAGTPPPLNGMEPSAASRAMTPEAEPSTNRSAGPRVRRDGARSEGAEGVPVHAARTATRTTGKTIVLARIALNTPGGPVRFQSPYGSPWRPGGWQRTRQPASVHPNERGR